MGQGRHSTISPPYLPHTCGRAVREKLGKGRACWEALPGAEWSSLPPPTVVAMTTEWGRKEERRDHLPLRQWKPIPGHPWPCPKGLGVVRSSGPFHVLQYWDFIGIWGAVLSSGQAWELQNGGDRQDPSLENPNHTGAFFFQGSLIL